MQRVVKEILLILVRIHFRRDESRCDCEVGSALPGRFETKTNVILLQYCYYNFSNKSGSSAGTAYFTDDSLSGKGESCLT
jgi:hypothetical protein